MKPLRVVPANMEELISSVDDSLLSAALVTEINTRTHLILSDVIALRRHLHRHPEASEREYATTDYLARLLTSLGLHPQVCESRTGLTCDLVHRQVAGSSVPRRLVLRGDIDGLPIPDAKAVDYRSTSPGLMHACGHDAHPAILYGTLRLLDSLKRDGLLPWSIAVRGVFQPAEEVSTGAMAMIHAHALREVDAAIALHVDPGRPVGRIGLRVGTLTASCDTFHLVFEGRGGHGARPHLAADPIEAAATWITTALRRIPRSADPHNPVIISVGKFHAGHASNVIPDSAEIEGTLRTLSKKTRTEALATLEDINESISKQSGVKIKLQFQQSSPPVDNDATIVQLIAAAAEDVLGDDCLDWIENPSMGSEDFSYYLDHVPGAMYRLGVAGDQVGHAPLHTPHFDIDEESLAVGIRVMTAATLRFFAPQG